MSFEYRLALMFAFLFMPIVRAESPAGKLLAARDDWFQTNEGRIALENILSWQTAYGDWPKNTDTVSSAFLSKGEKPAGSFDNGATVGELRVLARAYRISREERYKEAFLLGFQHIINAQYKNGGWPQYFPLSQAYHRHITFNDNTMIHLLSFLRDVAQEDDFGFLDYDTRRTAEESVERGLECIVNCQVVVDGVRLVWCAQHDAETLAPVQGRSFELASLSGAESAAVLQFLMSLEAPTASVKQAIHAGSAWFDAVKIEGYRYRKSSTEPALTRDPNAPLLWARFYSLESNRPIFSERDGIVKYDIEEISFGFRQYSWYGTWGAAVLEEYRNWNSRYGK